MLILVPVKTDLWLQVKVGLKFAKLQNSSQSKGIAGSVKLNNDSVLGNRSNVSCYLRERENGIPDGEPAGCRVKRTRRR